MLKKHKKELKDSCYNYMYRSFDYHAEKMDVFNSLIACKLIVHRMTVLNETYECFLAEISGISDEVDDKIQALRDHFKELNEIYDSISKKMRDLDQIDIDVMYPKKDKE